MQSMDLKIVVEVLRGIDECWPWGSISAVDSRDIISPAYKYPPSTLGSHRPSLGL